MNVYLDNAATTPLSPEALEAMMPYLKEHFGNPSSSHYFGRKTKTAIENARRSTARHLNCHPSELFFTSGGTEADNLAIHIAVRDLGCTHVITSPIEHSAVLKTSQALAEEGRIKLSLVRLLPDGHVDLEHLTELLKTEDKKLVSLMHGNNEIANILPLEKVGKLCADYGAYFHSDTVQTMGHFRFDLKSLPIHFVNAAAHKFHGPKGVGFIYINRTIRGHSDISGGGQERGMRGGTENVHGIVGMAAALDQAYLHLDSHRSKVSGLKSYMMGRLEEEIPGVRFNGDCVNPDSLYTLLNVTFPPTPNHDMLLFLLDLDGVAASGGSACSSGATKGSHVLDAIGALESGRASIRFSFSRYTTLEEVDYALSKISSLVELPREVGQAQR
jgi:cysteine desulfurase